MFRLLYLLTTTQLRSLFPLIGGKKSFLYFFGRRVFKFSIPPECYLENCNYTPVKIRVNNQLDTLFLMCLFHFCTRFEQPTVHHQENQLYQYIIWYISLHVGGHLVFMSETCIPDGHLHAVIYIPDDVFIDTIDSPDDENWVARNVYRSEINTLKKCVTLVINTNFTEMHGQQIQGYSK